MASVINTNMASLNAQRNLNTSQSALSTALQRLSSGLRINSAKDDAAGMAIASRMTSQINGLNQAARNANDAISLTQTAEGGLATATDLLQRMRELAVQSANSSNSDADRVSLQSEVSQLRSEIDRIAKSTAFNGINLLDGSFSAQTFQVGANSTVNDRVQINSITNMQSSSLGAGAGGGTASLTSGTTAGSDLKALAAGDLTLNGVQVGATAAGSLAGQSANSAWSVAQAINLVGAQSGVTAKANAAVASSVWVTGVAATAGDVAANSFSINGVGVGAIKMGTAFDGTTFPPVAGGVSDVAQQGANVAAAINAVKDQTGVLATSDEAGLVTLVSLTGKTIDIKQLGSYSTLTTDTGLTEATGAAPVSATDNSALTTADANGYQADSIRINGVSVGAIAGASSVAGQGANVAAAINLVSGKTGVTATADAITGALVLTAADGRNITLDDGIGDGGAGTATLGTTNDILGMDGVTTTNGLSPGAADGVFSGTVTLSSSNSAGIVVAGANTQYAGFGAVEGMVAADQGAASNALSAVDIGTQAGATSALATIDAALTQVNGARGAMGAYQNRFSSVVSNLQATAENLTASRSRIQDADFAAETAAMTRGQILQQAGTAILAQANSLPNSVLSLLK